MKNLLLLLFITPISFCFAQLQPEKLNSTNIADIELQAHQQQFNNFTQGNSSSAFTAASDNFDVKYYRCEWQLDPAVRYINGKITVYFTPVTAASNIVLDMMAPLVADSVKQQGINRLFSQPTNTLQINFATPLIAGKLDSVSIWYQGVPPNTGFGSFILRNHGNPAVPVMWSLSESYGARDWWPCKNGINDKADSVEVLITHSNIYKAASNGILQSITPIASNNVVTHYKHRYPIATYLICMAITNYATFSNTVQLGNVTLPMETFCYPENLAAFQSNTPKVLESMQLFNTFFGEYPFIKEKYGHVQFGFGGGMEHQSNSFINSTDESLMAHELAHQWFGDKITCNSWEDIWLNEGFATFAAAFHMETKYPQSILVNRQAIINTITSQPGGVLKVADTLNLGAVFGQRLSYNKGSYLLNMLRFMLGDDIFFKGIRRYQQDVALKYGNATTADFKRNLEEESGKNLTDFFNQWYTGQGYPSYTVKWSTIGSSTVNINVSQITSHPSVSFFKLPIALLFKNATQQKTIVVNNDFNNQNFIKTIGFIPDTVLIDPGLWLITKNNSTQKLATLNTGVGMVDVYPNPTTNPFTIYLHNFNETKASINIYNKLGQRVSSKNLNLTNGAELVQINNSNWAKGIYIMKIKVGNNLYNKQIIKGE